MRKSEWILGLVYLLLLAVLTLTGYWARRDLARACAYDGGKIDSLYQVRMVDDLGQAREFCCIGCAESWLERAKVKPRGIFVTDEAAGGEVEAAEAYFVRSLVVTTPTTGNRIHAFRSPEDAKRHAAFAKGQILLDAEKPFARSW